MVSKHLERSNLTVSWPRWTFGHWEIERFMPYTRMKRSWPNQNAHELLLMNYWISKPPRQPCSHAAPCMCPSMRHALWSDGVNTSAISNPQMVMLHFFSSLICISRYGFQYMHEMESLILYIVVAGKFMEHALQTLDSNMTNNLGRFRTASW